MVGDDMLHLPRPTIRGKGERLRSIYIPRLNLASPYGKTQSSTRLWRAKRTRIVSHIHFWGHDSVGQRHHLMRTSNSCFSASIEFQSSK